MFCSMDIVEFVNALNAKIANLEKENAELKEKVKEYEDKEAQSHGDNELEIDQLKELLEEEVSEHDFTRLKLDDEQTNAQLSLRMLRELQAATSSDAGALHASLQDRESAISKLQQELSTERNLRVQSEALAAEERQKTENQFATREALKAMVSLLTSQLKQNQGQLDAYERVITQQKVELDRKLSIFLDDQIGGDSATHVTSKAESHDSPGDIYLEELDTRFKAVLDLIEDVEGKPLNLDAASSIKAALREAKQVIGEEIILSHSKLKLETTLRQATNAELQNEKKTSTALLAVISELQTQLDIYLEDQCDSNEYHISFVSTGPIVGD